MIETICAVVMFIGAGVVIRSVGLWTLPSFAAIIFANGFGARAAMLHNSDIQVVFRYIPVSAEQSQTMSVAALYAFAAMCGGMFVGLRVRTKSSAAAAEPHRPHRNRRQPTAEALSSAVALGPRKYSVVMLVALALVLLGIQLAMFSMALGGPVGALIALSQRTLTSGSFGFAVNLTFVMMPLLLVALVRTKVQHPTRWLATVAFILAVVWTMIVNGRAAVVVALWSLAMAIQQSGRRKVSPWALIVGGSIVVVTTVVGLAWRMSAQTTTPLADNLGETSGEAATIMSDALPLFDHFRVGMEYVSYVGHDYSSSLLTGLTVLVPRSIWPGKPSFLPQELSAVIFYNGKSGLPAGLLGEGYIAFGWIGVVVYAFVFGLCIVALHRLTIGLKTDTVLGTWATFLASSFALGTLRTGAQGGLITLQVAALMLPIAVLAHLLSRRLAREAPLAHPVEPPEITPKPQGRRRP